MKKSAGAFIIFFVIMSSLLFLPGCGNTKSKSNSNSDEKYQPTWQSLSSHQTPEWLKDGKFGIYSHWGIYAVEAFGGNVTWYSYAVYHDTTSKPYKDFVKRFGKLTPNHGYKDLIPEFTASKFDANEWAKLFKESGAKFAGPVAEHHDGFAMWDTKYSDWNAAKMGPKQDVVGELAKAIKAQGLKFVTAFHHSENWRFFPTWDSTKDAGNPKYSGLYGHIHAKDDLYPNKEFLDEWYGKLQEVVDKYDPDFVWFDFALDLIREDYVKRFVTYYYNHAAAENKNVIISYKDHDLPPGVGLQDYELVQAAELTWSDWITDTSIDSIGSWGYVKDEGYKTVDNLVDNLVDRVSKNGYLLLNVGPKADGTIPEGAKEDLLGMGKWLKVNGEAIYGTRAWVKYGEGPTRLDRNGAFNEKSIKYTSKDIRFTTKGNVLYAIVLDWPGKDVFIKSLVPQPGDMYDYKYPGYYIFPDEIESISMLGSSEKLNWKLEKDGLRITTPTKKPCDYAYSFKIVLKESL